MARKLHIFYSALFCFACLLSSAHAAVTQIPSSAEVDRQKPLENKPTELYQTPEDLVKKTILPFNNAPASAKKVHFVLKTVNIAGATAFSKGELAEVYKDFIGKDVTLDIAWMIAGSLTEKYRSQGYFLSRAYVPEQEIKDGIIVIKVVEGYVGKVSFEKPEGSNRIALELIDRLTSKRPLKVQQIESFLLRINDIPGYSFKGVLSPLKGDDEAAVQMTLVSLGTTSHGSVGIDNYGSRFIGPNEFSANYQSSFLPLQQTNLSVFSSLPTKELKYGAIDHQIALTPDLKIGFNADNTHAYPGYYLTKYSIESRAASYGINLYYQLMRQRQENLLLKFGIDARDTNTDLQFNQISHDQIRVARATATYDFFDGWDGYNLVNVKLSQGIDGLGSSKAGDLNLTRNDAKPNFRKIELTLQRQENLLPDIALVTATSMQRASGTLYSSEQFGYGGQNFGRAFDSSEIIGDHGISGSAELRYNMIKDLDPVAVVPYTFYDIGKVWSIHPSNGQPGDESGSSAGFGVRMDSDIGVNGNLGLAFPLTRTIATPIYGHNGNFPRILLQVGKSF